MKALPTLFLHVLCTLLLLIPSSSCSSLKEKSPTALAGLPADAWAYWRVGTIVEVGIISGNDEEGIEATLNHTLCIPEDADLGAAKWTH